MGDEQRAARRGCKEETLEDDKKGDPGRWNWVGQTAGVALGRVIGDLIAEWLFS